MVHYFDNYFVCFIIFSRKFNSLITLTVLCIY